MEWFVKVFQRYADFEGRSRRKEYWMFTLFNLIFIYGLMILMSFSPLLMIIYLIYLLATIIPSLAVAVRRLHDVEKSGWFILLGFIPLVGAVILLVWMVSEGTKGPNKYGPDPKDESGSGHSDDTVLDSELV